MVVLLLVPQPQAVFPCLLALPQAVVPVPRRPRQPHEPAKVVVWRTKALVRAILLLKTVTRHRLKLAK